MVPLHHRTCPPANIVNCFFFLQVSGALKADQRSPEDCEQLFKKHKSFLSMASGPEMGKAFVAIVNDGYNADLNGAKADEQQMSQETVSSGAVKGWMGQVHKANGRQ